MGTFLGKLFIDSSHLPGGENCGGNSTIYNLMGDNPLGCDEKGFGFIQVLILFFGYGYILFLGSNMISDGSELLLLVPSLKGIVGSIVLPVLGAVPDGAIILFSGLGDDAQNQVAVGVGALAGSTIMLLTVPWILSIAAGRVDIDESGEAVYKKKTRLVSRKSSVAALGACEKISTSLFKTGVSPDSTLRRSAKIMFATSLIYLVIQGPAFQQIHINGQGDTSDNANGENKFSMIGFVFCLVAFVAYLVYQAKYADVSDSVDKVTREAIGKNLISLSGAFAASMQSAQASEDDPLLGPDRLKQFLRSFYNKYDINHDGKIDASELRLLFKDLNEHVTPERFQVLMAEMDRDHNGFIEFDEFVTAMGAYMLTSADDTTRGHLDSLNLQSIQRSESVADGESDDEEEEEVPEDIKPMSPEQQQRAIKKRSAWLLGIGSLLVLLFSDPMVDVLSEIANRIGIPPFYVAFVLAPVASNASELIAAYSYALKKTKKSITISLVTLAGAATMNNTFSLGIFLLLIFVRKLAWQFSAETISILVIQILMVLFMHKRVHRLFDACVVITFYPLCLVMVALLEGPGGLD